MEIDKNYSEMIQVMTEDDNMRVRKDDYDKLLRTDICEFFTILKTMEDRIEKRIEKNNAEKLKQDGKNKT